MKLYVLVSLAFGLWLLACLLLAATLHANIGERVWLCNFMLLFDDTIPYQENER